tara:strand:+ start:1015 stop:1473 length:459 start_codon:yes stop_codon:yes gene_type:complete
MYTKKSGRITFRSNRRPGYKRSGGYSNGKNRNRGNVSQLYQKYLKLAKEASSSGDRIQTEYYYQFADHYSRVMVELGIPTDLNENNHLERSNSISQTDENSDNIKKESDLNVDLKSKETENNSEDEIESDSIESVPFISEPIKKKSIKSKKN